MKKGIFAFAAIVLITLSGIAVCSALLPSNESVSSDEPFSSNISMSSITAQDYPPDDSYPLNGNNQPDNYSYDISGPVYFLPSDEAPLMAPPAQEAETGTPPTKITQISEGEYRQIGGPIRAIPGMVGPQIWIKYMGGWTMAQSAIYYGDWTYILVKNDQGRWISTQETYPNGQVYTKNWGYFSPGTYYFRFIGDAVGWHKVVIADSYTGRQSNALWIDVRSRGPSPGPGPGPGPTPTRLTVKAWASSPYYYIGSPSCIYYSVNKPCYARITYLKQNNNIVWTGPYYVGAGTHTDTGTIGYPRGMRVVVVDAWTSSGEHAFDVTSYNVV